jgi:hypothetical protein
MRSVCWIVILAICLPLVAGCGSSGPTAEDSAFEKDLAKAAATKNGPPKTKSKSLADVKARYDAAQSAPKAGN